MTATDVTIIDTLDSNLSFVPNSFTVNGQTIPNADLSTGVNIGSINGGTAESSHSSNCYHTSYT